jgi:hypothetical protein
LVFVDLSKSYKKPSTKSILNVSHVIAYVMPPNLANIDNFKEKRKKDQIIGSNKILPLLSKSDESSGYNVKNTSRYMEQKKYIASVPYNVRFMEATNEARAAEFFTKFKLSASSINEDFFNEVERSCTVIIEKLKELNL